MSTYSTEPPPEEAMRTRKRRDALLWLIVLGAPTIWLANFQFIYSMALWSFHSHRKFPLHIGVVVSLVLCGGAAWLSWRAHQRAPAAPESPGDDAPEIERVRFMVHLGIWGTALFILGIVAQWVAIFMINPAVD